MQRGEHGHGRRGRGEGLLLCCYYDVNLTALGTWKSGLGLACHFCFGIPNGLRHVGRMIGTLLGSS
jgi:hypothetical protein